MRINDHYLDRIAVDIDRYGIAVVESDIATILDVAHDAGVTSPALDVLADCTANDVVRTRALAVVIAHLSRHTTRPTPTSRTTPTLATAGAR